MILTREMRAGSRRFGGGHDLVEDAVDAEADAEDLLVGLEVDVGGAAADGVDEDHVDELDDGGLVGRLLELEDVDLGARFVLVEELDVADLALELVDDLADRAQLDVVVAPRWPCGWRPGRPRPAGPGNWS